jgi:hypothetical protein
VDAGQTGGEVVTHSEDLANQIADDGGQRSDHLAERSHRQEAKTGRALPASRNVGLKPLVERPSREPPKLGQDQSRTHPTQEEDRHHQAAHDANTRSSSGMRMMRPAHDQHTTTMRMATATIACAVGSR